VAEEQFHGISMLLQMLVEVWNHESDQFPQVSLEKITISGHQFKIFSV
jgi:hypothetical protein